MGHTVAESAGSAPSRPVAVDMAGWKSGVALVSALLLGLLFIAAGVWKIVEPYGMSTRLTQLLVPGALALPAAIGLGVVETFAGTLLIIPQFRRWGAWATGLLLVAFMVYVGVNYSALLGAECSCFPWIKRSVGPGFFIGDLAMLAMAAAAGVWSRRPEGLRTPALILGALVVFAATCFGVATSRQQGNPAPASITVNGQPYSLKTGRVFVYFFDPECMHCDEAARRMAKHSWQSDVRVVAVPTRVPQFADQFLRDTGLKAVVSNDFQLLKSAFPFGDAPYGVALEHGRQKASMGRFDEAEPAASLREIHFIE